MRFLETDELINEVEAATQNLTFNGRIAPELTERAIRYYVTMRYVSPPQRREGRRAWTESHVNELIRLRRALSAGQSLKELARAGGESSQDWKASNIGIHRAELIESPLFHAQSQVTHARSSTSSGWSRLLSNNLVLNGFTSRPPTEQELLAVTEALSNLIGEQTEELEKEEQ